MLKQNIGSLSSADAESISLEPKLGDSGFAADTGTPDPSVHDQLARDIADIRISDRGAAQGGAGARILVRT